MQRYRHFFFDFGVIGAQDLQYLRTAEVIGHLAAFRKYLAQHRSAHQQAIFVGVRARLTRSHAVALAAVESPAHAQWPNLERTFGNLIEDFLRIERSVEVADAGMIATDEKVAAAEVLAEDGVLQRRSRNEVILHERVDRPNAHFGGYVAELELAQFLMNEDTVADFDRNLREMLVRAVHRIAQLKRRNRLPSALLEQRTDFGGAQIQAGITLGIEALADHLDLAGQVDVGTLHHALHAGV